MTNNKEAHGDRAAKDKRLAAMVARARASIDEAAQEAPEQKTAEAKPRNKRSKKDSELRKRSNRRS